MKWCRSRVIKKLFSPLLLCLILVGCVSAPHKKDGHRLELKSPQKISYSAYRSESETQEFNGEQKVRDRKEGVDFIVKASPFESKSPVSLMLTTVAKKGSQNLNEYGFPELNESIEFHYMPTGQVLKADSFSPTSLFYIPPVPLPDGPVEIGDTWEVKHQWISDSGGLLELKVIGILKDVLSCKGEGKCARIEISGGVEPVGLDPAAVQVTSKIYGDLIFSLDRGDVESSKVKSNERVILPSMRVESKSCMVSLETTSTKLNAVKFPTCN